MSSFESPSTAENQNPSLESTKEVSNSTENGPSEREGIQSSRSSSLNEMYASEDDEDSIIVDISCTIRKGIIMSKLVITLLDTFWELAPIVLMLKEIVVYISYEWVNISSVLITWMFPIREASIAVLCLSWPMLIWFICICIPVHIRSIMHYHVYLLFDKARV